VILLGVKDTIILVSLPTLSMANALESAMLQRFCDGAR